MQAAWASCLGREQPGADGQQFLASHPPSFLPLQGWQWGWGDRAGRVGLHGHIRGLGLYYCVASPLSPTPSICPWSWYSHLAQPAHRGHSGHRLDARPVSDPGCAATWLCGAGWPQGLGLLVCSGDPSSHRGRACRRLALLGLEPSALRRLSSSVVSLWPPPRPQFISFCILDTFWGPLN